ncbi:S41 family peptidase [Stenotrophomonas maltophilia]|nr:S41 family peptidase [Stenotrophomonas maltophilia]MCI1059878.1 S41 family peptidase [Stenotrophomonas maltophilia]MCI1063063.1 S41 family peptidase [Stenotrophomonas maltophilia]MCI1079234.1 S41 family peptidase [Stenotrophomonas maltophilia]MCI1084415.1 S41 family peptidase [Stenotrophomonas maltophilia]MCI1096280.1 S41 family peptidase [Stenotrophomonas maltophilia]
MLRYLLTTKERRMSIDLRVMATALSALFCTTAQAVAPDAIDLPTAQAQAQLLDMLEKESLYRDRVDWRAIRTRLKAAQNEPAEARAVLRQAIGRSSGGHGAWISAKQLQAKAERLARANGTATVAQKATTAPAEALDPRIGRVEIEGYSVMQGLTAHQQMKERAKRWQAIIDDQDNGSRCGWIVDLRGNTGGNMWPMLLGVAPLLRVTPSADENVGSFAAAEGPSLWQLTSSSVRLGDRVRIDLGGPGYLLKHPGAPVAVLTGPRTASSGEATVLSFRGRPQTRSFGQPTSGLSTANVMRPLADGSALLLTTSVMRDRTGRGDGLKISPDQRTDGDAATLAAAQAWLLARPACAGH